MPFAKTLPDSFPPRTLSIMRALCALTEVEKEAGQEKLIEAFDALYEGFWVGRRPTHEPEVLKEILLKTLGRETAAKGESIPILCR